MKMSHVLMTVLLAAPAVWAAEPTAGGSRAIVICMDRAMDPWMILRAQTTAARMFEAIGVTIDWRSTHNCADERDIVIELRSATPQDYQPVVLAQALPYEGSHIRVFYDRVQNAAEPGIFSQLLAHVLVHEITHILEGIVRHSDTGVMKAHWDGKDYDAMISKRLLFAPEDILLIHDGLLRRYGTYVPHVSSHSPR